MAWSHLSCDPTHWPSNDTRGHFFHYNDVIMSMAASQITSLTIIYSAFYSGQFNRKCLRYQLLRLHLEHFSHISGHRLMMKELMSDIMLCKGLSFNRLLHVSCSTFSPTAGVRFHVHIIHYASCQLGLLSLCLGPCYGFDIFSDWLVPMFVL